MPRNANHGISALHVFVALADAYIDGRKEVTLNELKRTLIKDLHEYLTDGRSRSAKRAVKILAEYSLVEESKNRFGEPVYSLKDKLDTAFSIFLFTLAFLDDMTKGRAKDKNVLERVETVLPAFIEVLRENGCFAGIPKEKENVFMLIFEELSSEQGISLYAATKFFHRQPQILRLYNMFAWLAFISERYGNNMSAKIVLMAFYEVCKTAIPENMVLTGSDKDKANSFPESPFFRDIEVKKPVRSILNTWPNMPKKIKEKLEALNEVGI